MTDVPLTKAQEAELKRRVEAHNRSPHEGSSWEDVKKRIRNRRGVLKSRKRQHK